MQFINRSIIIIKAKRPFLDWVNSTDPKSDFKMTLEQIRSNPTSILVPEFTRPSEAKAYLKKIYNDIWEWELRAYWTDERTYPKHRPFEKFCEWFDVEFGSEVFEFVDEEIVREET